MRNLKTAVLLLIPGLAAGAAAAVMAANRGESRETTITQVLFAFGFLAVLSLIMNATERGATTRKLTQLPGNRRRQLGILTGLLTFMSLGVSFWIIGVNIVPNLTIAAGAAGIIFYIMNKEMPPEK